MLLAGCKDSKAPPDRNVSDSPGTPTLTATPNPVPAGSGSGTTKIDWNTGDGSTGQVYVSRDGAPEKLYAEGKKGSKEATWIQGGATYNFRLYTGKEHAKMIATVTVTREKN
jgi:hypothetical protein